MKKIKLLVAITLLLTSTFKSFANDYAILNTYPLLDEMKSAKKQQNILDKIHTTIIEQKYDSQKQLANLKKQFIANLEFISKGTKVTAIKNKIEELKLQWKQNNYLLDSAINNKMYKKEAFDYLTQLSRTLTLINQLYTQSYSRYKRNSIMKSLVNSYIQEFSKTKYALNTVK